MADPTGFTPTQPASVTAGPSPARSDEAASGHQPYVRDDAVMKEFTWSAVLVGAVLGIVFGASSLYLVLKVGLTVSASIPVAVLSITLFRGFSKAFGVRNATILENNIVQTTGSAGESIAFGVGVTMPALMLLGFEMSVGRVLIVSILGGLLGILMMIPLRRAFIVKQHGILKYPEGTACADVLIAGEKGGATAKTVFVGFGIAFVYEFLRMGFKFFRDEPGKALKFFKNAVPAIEVTPTLLGVGYIIGTRIASIMAAGGVLAAFVLIPAITFFGDKLPSPLLPGDKLISKMSAEDIGKQYVLYIGAGAVAAGGIISVFQALPLIWSSMIAGVRDLRTSRSGTVSSNRTDRDMPLLTVGIGTLVLVVAIWLTHPLHQVLPWVPDLHMNPVGALLIVLFGFLFVTVSSRLTGEIGSSSNPISGMTVATLLLTCLIFVLLGWTKPEDRLTALSIAAVVCIAASNGGTTSQDLKTGYLVGATPKWQQWAILVGALTSALVIGFILIELNAAYTVYTTKNLPNPAVPLPELTDKAKAPDDDTEYWVWRAAEGNEQKVKPGKYLVDDKGQIRYLVDPGINGQRKQHDDGTEAPRFKAPKAVLMAIITDGVLRQKLPWGLVLIGVSIAVVLEMSGVPSLAFAVGIYLPMSATTPIFAGGLVRYGVERRRRAARTAEGSAPLPSDEDTSPGSLLSTGYIAGGAIAGVVIAFLSFSDTIPRQMAVWQYRTYATQADAKAPSDAATEAAKHQLGIQGDVPDQRKDEVKELAEEIGEKNEDLTPRFWPVPMGYELKLPKGKKYTASAATTLGAVAEEQLGSESKAQLLLTLNMDRLVLVPAGTKLKMPRDYKQVGQPFLQIVPAQVLAFFPQPNLGSGLSQIFRLQQLADTAALDEEQIAVWDKKSERFIVKEKTVEVAEKTPLGEVAKKLLGKEERAQELYELNDDDLKPEMNIPKGTALKLPQDYWPALAAFGILIAILGLVGTGYLFREMHGPNR